MAYYGGNWSNGANAGLFNLNVNNAASNANSNIGGRLANEHSQKAHGSTGPRPAHILWGHCPDHAVEDLQGAAASSHGECGSTCQSLATTQCHAKSTTYTVRSSPLKT